jgi:hypothetical protein
MIKMKNLQQNGTEGKLKNKLKETKMTNDVRNKKKYRKEIPKNEKTTQLYQKYPDRTCEFDNRNESHF